MTRIDVVGVIGLCGSISVLSFILVKHFYINVPRVRILSFSPGIVTAQENGKFCIKINLDIINVGYRPVIIHNIIFDDDKIIQPIPGSMPILIPPKEEVLNIYMNDLFEPMQFRMAYAVDHLGKKWYMARSEIRELNEVVEQLFKTPDQQK